MCGSTRVLRLVVLAVLLALPALAWASRPDAVWIGGVYDDADADDVVLAITSAVGTLVPVAAAAVPVCSPPLRLLPSPGGRARPPAVPAGPPRAPPLG
jgi:hypothetical protein